MRRRIQLARAAITLVVALGALGCGGPNVGPVTTGEAAAPEPEPPREYVAVTSWLGRDLRRGLRRVRRLGHLSRRYQIFGVWRVELERGGTSRVAEQSFYGAVTDARRCGDGFVFVTWEGTIAYAETFTGELRAIGRLPSRDSDPQYRLRTHAGLVLVSDRTLAYHGPCEGPLRRAEPVRGLGVRAIWGEEDRRVALVDGGDAYVSEDRGTQWRRVQLPERPRHPDFALDGRFGTESGWLAIDAMGAAAGAERPSREERNWDARDEDNDEGFDDAEERARRALGARRYPARRAVYEMPVSSDPPSQLVAHSGSRALLVRDGESTELEWPDEEAVTDCYARRFGPTSILICRGRLSVTT